MENWYAVLGVTCTAPAEQLGQAYRRPACQCRPDVDSGKPEAAKLWERFVATGALLLGRDHACSDFGEDSPKNGLDVEQSCAGRGSSTRRVAPGGKPSETEASDFDLADPLATGFGRNAPVDTVDDADLFAVVWLDLAQAIQGALVNVDVPLAERCNDCLGTGRDPRVSPETCPRCQGSGQQRVTRGSMRFVVTCPHCHGQAEISVPCPTCRGRGYRRTLQRMTVHTPPGTDDGSTLRISGRGLPGPGDDPPGDLVIETRVRPHPLFRRDGLDLHLRLPVTLDEAYSGADLEIPTFDGRVKVLIPAGSQSGSQLRLRGKGITRGTERGDLYVEVDVRLPERHDERLAQAMRVARSAYLHPLRKKLRP